MMMKMDDDKDEGGRIMTVLGALHESCCPS
jgi:hypothetical protein